MNVVASDFAPSLERHRDILKEVPVSPVADKKRNIKRERRGLGLKCFRACQIRVH